MRVFRITAALAALLCGPAAAADWDIEATTLQVQSATSNYPSTAAAFTAADGRYVLFSSRADDLLAGMAGEVSSRQVYVHDRVAGTTSLISHLPGQPEVHSPYGGVPVGLSDDGRFVLYQKAYRSAPGTPPKRAIWLYDRLLRSHALANHAWNDADAIAAGFAQAKLLSADGRRVVFESSATDLVEGYVPPPQGEQ